LDDLLIALDDLWTEYEALSSFDTLLSLKSACMALRARLQQWQTSRAVEFIPTTIAQIEEDQLRANLAVGSWPGAVDTYLDLSIAGAWNVFRAAHILLATLAVQIARLSGDESYGLDVRRQALSAAQGIFSSLPYHLADNLPAFVKEQAQCPEIADPGKHLGGLLLMHPLYVVSKTPFFTEDMQNYARDCLEWIGTYMGIGQASFLATVSLTRASRANYGELHKSRG
jgi:hypothetical protein